MNRRRMLLDSAAYIAGLGLASYAFADGKKLTAKGIKGTDATGVEAKHPEGSASVLDAKLSPEAERIRGVLLPRAKHAIALALTNQSAKFTPKTVYAAAAKQVQKLPAARLQKAKTRAASQLSSSTKTATFGTYAKAELASATVPKRTTDVELTAVLRDIVAKQKAPPKQVGATFTKLQFQLNSIKCVEETSGISGSDELMFSAKLLGDDGKVSTFPTQTYAEFDTGETRYFDYEICKSFTKEQVAKFPKQVNICPNGGPNDIYKGKKLFEATLEPGSTYALMLFAGEEDGGGFGEFMQDTYDYFKDEINAALDDLGKAAGTAASSWFGALGPILGQALAEIAKAAVEFFFGMFEDDTFMVQPWVVTLDKNTQAYIKGLANDPLPSPKGTWASPMKKVSFKGHGGHYSLRLHWRASA